ncbi:MAG: PQQ-binding-like beta-propeller repeat protein [Eubacteriales bacterium]
MITNSVMWDFGGKDPFSYRIWQAYDSSALIDADTDTLIEPGENGVLYTVKLNTTYDESTGTLTMNPDGLVKYRYTTPEYGEGNESRWWGIENSIATWRNYAFFTDNGGFLQCVDLNTMELIYSVDVLDDSDVSIVIEEDAENDTFYLYTANEVDKQAGALSSGYGKSYHRKIDGPTGKVIWEKDYKASVGNTSSNGGTLATPALGKGEISNLIIYAMDMVPIEVSDDEGGTKTVLGGRLIAYDKDTGEVVWSKEQKSDYWSSPVLVYSDTGKAYLVQCDRGGYMKLYDAATGSELYSLDLGSRIDATPSVYGDMIVIGTRGVGGSGDSQKIIGIKIK